ncbi:MAG: anthranilate synthase component I [Gallionellales bacterium 35-53-114]|jgi:anthranilate synthase component 1|nr:MAG: anthranilate synthase component I [Gallionellales bacterium 35-53-114]OYZ64547.1 MAG: anthranilate synthase component I [Gallionellales bacterium 24-53-125]OZB10145.1 MAG: anthranilate synthase component I [Gallionellales bacterium 39-52-133]HQS56730.1 anthranilate synthase component I [Gallionellaceae bacterium]HQS75486.1 anthranilate synthase component I [Gallionellaceae bacterium]
MLHPITEQAFNELARQGYNRIPLVAETFADLDTPLSLYLKLANKPYSYLLESVQGGERFGRYSFIGLPADTRISVQGKEVTLTQPSGDTTQTVENPLDYIQHYQSQFKVAPLSGLPRFTGGLAGYFGYDTVRYIEPRLAQTQKKDVIGTPDILLMLTEQLAVVDNLSGKLTFIVYADPAKPDSYRKSLIILNNLQNALRKSVTIPNAHAFPREQAQSEFGEAAFKAAVEKSKRYIFDGDIMQVVLSQRMVQPFPGSPLSLYRALRSINPSPYMFYYDMGDHHVVGASPEILVRLEGDNVTVRPIAGTRPRGKSPEQDADLAEELLADPKELAEHLMLIDLGRNDIGRVAERGTVKLTDKMVIERYSHVMHIVSNVEAKLKPGMSTMDVLKATFPAGTVSGAAKVRAMEIIDELEPSKRGVYAGAVGYLGFNGDMDLAIALRTAVVKDNTLYVQAGAGIVADSIPESEWLETQNKARAVLRAAEIVLDGLDAKIHK